MLSYKGYQEIMGQEEENWSKEEERRERKNKGSNCSGISIVS